MQIINLYKYARPDGGITVTPTEPKDIEYTDDGVRLIADEGKILTNDKELTYCIDVPSSEGWYEIEEPAERKVSIIEQFRKQYSTIGRTFKTN